MFSCMTFAVPSRTTSKTTITVYQSYRVRTDARSSVSLDNLTEELEETADNAIYDDYEFLTPDELDKLGLSDLIGTNLLRAYMHGFLFVDARLYKKAKSIVEPSNYEDYKYEYCFPSQNVSGEKSIFEYYQTLICLHVKLFEWLFISKKNCGKVTSESRSRARELAKSQRSFGGEKL